MHERIVVLLSEVPALKLGLLKEGGLHHALPKRPAIQCLLRQSL